MITIVSDSALYAFLNFDLFSHFVCREEAVQQAFLAHRNAATLTMRNKSNRATGATVQVADKEARAVACARYTVVLGWCCVMCCGCVAWAMYLIHSMRFCREADEALAEVITASLASKKRNAMDAALVGAGGNS